MLRPVGGRLRQPGPGRPAGRGSRPRPAASRIRSRPEPPHFARAGQAGDLPVHARRAVAGRHVRLQAAAANATTASRCRSPSRGSFRPQTGNLLKSPWKFQQYGQSGAWVSELFPHVAQLRRRPVHHQLDARLELAARRRAAGTAHRQRHVRPAEHGLVDHLRPGHREPEPARLHHHLPDADARRREQLQLGVPARPSTRARRWATPASRPTRRRSRSSTTPTSSRRDCSGWNSTCCAQMNREHLARDRPGLGARRRASTRSNWPSACRPPRPKLQDIADETEATQQAVRPRRPARPTNFGRQCLMARRFAERGVRFVQVHAQLQVGPARRT